MTVFLAAWGGVPSNTRVTVGAGENRNRKSVATRLRDRELTTTIGGGQNARVTFELMITPENIATGPVTFDAVIDSVSPAEAGIMTEPLDGIAAKASIEVR